MSLLRVPLSGLACGQLELDQPTAHYVTRVHRLSRGDVFLAFDPEIRMQAEARLTEVSRSRVCCQVDALVPASRLACRRLLLFLGLCKGDRFDWALREATALGATDLVPVLCARSVVRPSDSASRITRWKRIIVEGARQCGRGDSPELHPVLTLDKALSQELPQETMRLCLWEQATAPLREKLIALGEAQPVSVLIGPEGGLEPDEATLALTAGYACVSIGPLILRAETAVVATLGAIAAMSTR